ESLVAAIYLDGGLEQARVFILRYVGPEIEAVAEGAHGGNFKSLLQQAAQREFSSTPQYVLLDEKGPDHSKGFKVAAQIGRYTYAGAWGRNKKEAEQKAAMNALAQINGDPSRSRRTDQGSPHAERAGYFLYLPINPPAGPISRNAVPARRWPWPGRAGPRAR